MTLDLHHKGIVFDSSIKCVVCLYVCGENAPNNRCKKCQNYNRKACEKCHVYPIKVHYTINTEPLLCEYCGGTYKRINDICYQQTSDYDSKYRIRIFDSQPTIKLCIECYVSNSTPINETMSRCDMCHKTKYDICTMDRKDFLEETKQCTRCNIYCDSQFCKKCTDLLSTNTDLFRVENIGAYFKVWTTLTGHPKMKFEKHLIDLQKYKNYGLYFVGKLSVICDDNSELDPLAEFENVTFQNQGNKKPKSWKIHKSDILFYEKQNFWWYY